MQRRELSSKMRITLLGASVYWILSAGQTAFAQSPDPLDQQLRAIVERQADAWNRGQIDEFMQAYWHSEQLTFSSGGQTERGWDATRRRYYARYPDREAMGKLTFSRLEVQPLGDEAALMLGCWQLERTSKNVGGNFSLVWRKFESRWLIVHDHTSTAIVD